MRAALLLPRGGLALVFVLLAPLACSKSPPAGEAPPIATGGRTSPPGSGGGGGTPSTPAVDSGAPVVGTGGTVAVPPGTGGAGGSATAPDAASGDVGGEAAPPVSGERLTDGLKQLLLSRGIGLGYYHSCHLLASKEIKCFNTGDDERFHPPAVKSTQINCAHDGCCVLTGGGSTLPAGTAAKLDAVSPIANMIQAKRLACWSHKTSFFPPAALDMNPIWFGIGYDHGCALNQDHSVVCWGNPGSKAQPPAVVNEKKVKSMAVASFFNCAVLMDDSVVCWGVNPPLPPDGLKAKLVAGIFHSNPKLPDAPTGTRHACAIQLDDTLKCWGDNVEGTTDVPADLGPVKDVALATYNSCVLKLDGEPRCWGTKRYNDIAERWHPMPDPKTLKFKGIRAKLAAYCGLNFDDTLTCWGDESSTHLTLPKDTKIFTSP